MSSVQPAQTNEKTADSHWLFKTNSDSDSAVWSSQRLRYGIYAPIQQNLKRLQKVHLCGKLVYTSIGIRLQNICEWSACFLEAFSLSCRHSKQFCELPFALKRQQPETDKQNVDVAHPRENFLRTPMYVIYIQYQIWNMCARMRFHCSSCLVVLRIYASRGNTPHERRDEIFLSSVFAVTRSNVVLLLST